MSHGNGAACLGTLRQTRLVLTCGALDKIEDPGGAEDHPAARREPGGGRRPPPERRPLPGDRQGTIDGGRNGPVTMTSPSATFGSAPVQRIRNR